MDALHRHADRAGRTTSACTTRAIRAVAEVVDSPAGVLFVRAPEDVAFQWAGSWNMPAVDACRFRRAIRWSPQFRDGDWIVELDKLPPVAELAGGAAAHLACGAAQPSGQLIGFVVLARSRAQFKLDREVFDLLRIVGREVASQVAEQRAAQVLIADAAAAGIQPALRLRHPRHQERSGQLSMLLSNAEVHADNPEFQRDMLATVRASVGKITRLLTRLQARRQRARPALIAPMERLHGARRPATRQTARHRRSSCRPTTAAAPAWRSIPDAFDAVVHASAGQRDRGVRGAAPGARARAPRGAERGGRHHRRGAGDDAGVHPRRAVPAVRARRSAAGTASASIRRASCCARPAAICWC